MDNDSQKPKKNYYFLTLKVVGEFGVAIALPIILLVLLGKYLDNLTGKQPLFTLIGFIVAIFVAGKLFMSRAKQHSR